MQYYSSCTVGFAFASRQEILACKLLDTNACHQSAVLTLMCMQQRTSHCYRIAYRSMERSLTDEEINGLQEQTRKALAEEMHVELR